MTTRRCISISLRKHVEVIKGELDDASTESIGGILLSLSFGDDSHPAFLFGEVGRGDELVPFFLKEGVDCLFLSTLLGLGQSLILSL